MIIERNERGTKRNCKNNECFQTYASPGKPGIIITLLPYSLELILTWVLSWEDRMIIWVSVSFCNRVWCHGSDIRGSLRFIGSLILLIYRVTLLYSLSLKAQRMNRLYFVFYVFQIQSSMSMICLCFLSRWTLSSRVWDSLLYVVLACCKSKNVCISVNFFKRTCCPCKSLHMRFKSYFLNKGAWSCRMWFTRMENHFHHRIKIWKR